jgi:hypothetical protein
MRASFFGARPALDLTFDGDGVGDVQKVLRPNQRDGSPCGGMATVDTLVLLIDALIESEPS